MIPASLVLRVAPALAANAACLDFIERLPVYLADITRPIEGGMRQT